MLTLCIHCINRELSDLREIIENWLTFDLYLRNAWCQSPDRRSTIGLPTSGTHCRRLGAVRSLSILHRCCSSCSTNFPAPMYRSMIIYRVLVTMYGCLLTVGVRPSRCCFAFMKRKRFRFDERPASISVNTLDRRCVLAVAWRLAPPAGPEIKTRQCVSKQD